MDEMDDVGDLLRRMAAALRDLSEEQRDRVALIQRDPKLSPEEQILELLKLAFELELDLFSQIVTDYAAELKEEYSKMTPEQRRIKPN
jgi:hypothetical protein